MEGRVREKTLTGMFLKYIVIFCVNIGLIFIGAYIVLVLLSMTGQVLPANYAEQWDDRTKEAVTGVARISEEGYVFAGRILPIYFAPQSGSLYCEISFADALCVGAAESYFT